MTKENLCIKWKKVKIQKSIICYLLCQSREWLRHHKNYSTFAVVVGLFTIWFDRMMPFPTQNKSKIHSIGPILHYIGHDGSNSTFLSLNFIFFRQYHCKSNRNSMSENLWVIKLKSTPKEMENKKIMCIQYRTIAYWVECLSMRKNSFFM